MRLLGPCGHVYQTRTRQRGQRAQMVLLAKLSYIFLMSTHTSELQLALLCVPDWVQLNHPISVLTHSVPIGLTQMGLQEKRE